MNEFLSEDLWASLSHTSSKPVADVMETWTKQVGYPLLSVTAEQVCLYEYSATDLFSRRGFYLLLEWSNASHFREPLFNFQQTV